MPVFEAVRFIPACAGNRNNREIVQRPPAVHPRVCGEQIRSDLGRRCRIGSSPRVRGTVRCSDHLPHFLRFIPACAGNSCLEALRSSALSVHPRVCGEQPVRRHLPPRWYGSSPRVRGTVSKTTLDNMPTRFIPACAGNRHRPAQIRWPCPVHPRVCGEQFFRQFGKRSSSGSSPRVRGTVTPRSGVRRNRRFIPACAGNSMIFLSLF